MHFNTLDRLRQQMYGCFERSRDALFNLSDALLSESQARSLPELSLSVFFERRWPSVYEALQDGRINVERLREVFVQALLERPCRPMNRSGWVLIVAYMKRLEARKQWRSWHDLCTQHAPCHQTRQCGLPVFDADALAKHAQQLGGYSGATSYLSAQTAIEVGIDQLRALLPLMPRRRVILLADRWYATAALCGPVVSRVLGH